MIYPFVVVVVVVLLCAGVCVERPVNSLSYPIYLVRFMPSSFTPVSSTTVSSTVISSTQRFYFYIQ